MKPVIKIANVLQIILIYLLFATSCSSGSVSSPNNTGGIEGTGKVLNGNTFLLGSISSSGKQGLINVNGVQFSTEKTTVTIDGNKKNADQLSVGMVVQVTSNYDKGDLSAEAIDVVFETNIKGIIDSIDLEKKSLMIAGQAVIINSLTVYEGVKVENLAIGNIVLISGFKAANHEIEASLVKFISNSFIAGSESTIIISEIKSLNTTTKTFLMGAISVAYNGAKLDGLKESDLKDGLNIKVLSDTNISNSLLIASRLQFTTESLAGNQGHKVEIEGFVNKIISATQFEVNGQPIFLNSSSVFENGSASEIVINARVEVEGELDALGNITATEIELIIEGDIEMEAIIQTIGLSSFTCLGLEIQINNSTLFVDETTVNSKFNLTSLLIGERIDIIASKNSSGLIVAKRVARKQRDEVVASNIGDITAVIGNLARPNFNLAGVQVLVKEGITIYEGITGDPKDSNVFFAIIKNGSIVEVEGTLVGGILEAAVIKIVVP